MRMNEFAILVFYAQVTYHGFMRRGKSPIHDSKGFRCGDVLGSAFIKINPWNISMLMGASAMSSSSKPSALFIPGAH